MHDFRNDLGATPHGAAAAVPSPSNLYATLPQRADDASALRYAVQTGARNCQDYADAGFTVDGLYGLTRASGHVFSVECHFDGQKGWIVLEMGGVDGAVAGQKGLIASSRHISDGTSMFDPWWKCADGSRIGSAYTFLSVDRQGGTTTATRTAIKAIREFGVDTTQPYSSTALAYFNPATSRAYTAEEVEHIRAVTEELSDDTPIVCADGDADDANSHEATLVAADGSTLVCTPCYGNDCGSEGTCKSVTSPDCTATSGQTAIYTWRTSQKMVSSGSAAGCTGYRDELPPKFIMPVSVSLRVASGGGAAFGYATRRFHVGGTGTGFAAPPLSPSRPPSPSAPLPPLGVLASCQAYAEAGVRADGVHAINPADPFNVQCVFLDGAGWMALEVGASNSSFKTNLPSGTSLQKHLVAASQSNDNPFWKCADDMASFYPFLSDSSTGGTTANGTTAVKQVGAFVPGGNGASSTPLVYFDPQSGTQYTDAQMAYIRSQAARLHPDTPIVCTEADADGGNYQTATSSTGHEAYLYATDGERLVCTPCNGNDCGGSCPSDNSCTGMSAGGKTAGASQWTDHSQRTKKRRAHGPASPRPAPPRPSQPTWWPRHTACACACCEDDAVTMLRVLASARAQSTSGTPTSRWFRRASNQARAPATPARSSPNSSYPRVRILRSARAVAPRLATRRRRYSSEVPPRPSSRSALPRWRKRSW